MIFRSVLVSFLCASTASAFTAQQKPSSRTTTTTPTSLSSAAVETEPPVSPLTEWGSEIEDIVRLQAEWKKKKLPEFGPEISSVKDLGIARDDTSAQLQYFRDNAMEIKNKMELHGAVVFRDFGLMKDPEGFKQFYEAVGMNPCLDPLHAVSARPTADGKKGSAVYEAVNKESRKNFFIGMHNEFVGTRAPRAAAFACFKPADVGGEFIIADGRRVFLDLSPSTVKELYERNIRYSVMELPFFGFVDNVPEPVRGPVMGALKGVVSGAINAKVDFNVEMLWGEGGYDNVRMLQARAPSQPPIVLHPTTGEPTWFCNVHSHSSQLRKQREEKYGAERFEDGASQINKSDMFYGDDEELSPELLKELDECTYKNMKYVKMTEGDVVLLDNYKTMHGRNVFDGTRKHCVAWFEGWTGEEEQKELLNEQIEKDSSSPAMPFFANFLQ